MPPGVEGPDDDGLRGLPVVAEVMGFGRYDLESLIGRGGMGEVYRAYDRDQRRMVALKLLPQSLASDAAFVERFKRESHAAAKLRDPHVLPIHQYGEIEGRLYIDMRLVDGRDLGDVIVQDGPFVPARAVHIVRQTAQALEAAHADNLVHRDVKPSNILVTGNDFAYLVDFGIARSIGAATAGTSLTSTGSTVGTLGYMAPERFSGRGDIDGRVDVYALACVLFEMLTGRRPFPFDDLPSLLNAHLNAPPPRVTELRPELSPAWDDVVARGMAKQVGDRYATPSALAEDAGRALGGGALLPSAPPPWPQAAAFTVTPGRVPPAPRPAPTHARPTRPAARRVGGGFGIWVAASASVLVAVVVGGVLVITSNPGGRDGTTPVSPADVVTTSSAAPSGPAQGTGTALGAGDLDLSVPVTRPACDGRFGVFVGGSVDPTRYVAEIQGHLDRYRGSRYLYGEAACPSIRARDDQGNSVYAVYYGPYPTLDEACDARNVVGAASYVLVFDTATPVGQGFAC